MARVSKAERDQATRFIKESLQGKIKSIEEDPEISDLRDRARELVLEEVQYEATLKRAEDLSEEIKALDKTREELIDGLKKALGRNKNHDWRWDYETGIRETTEVKFLELLEEHPLGSDLRRLKDEAKEVERKVFMQTTHEDLADLVRELS